MNPGSLTNPTYYQNPNGSLPQPVQTGQPIPFWHQEKTRLVWSAAVQVGPEAAAGGTLNYLVDAWQYTATWTSPLFDLRPDLRSSQNGPKTGIPIDSTAARIFCQLFNAENAGSNFTIRAKEFANTVIANNITTLANGNGPDVPAITPFYAVTGAFINGASAPVAGFSPPDASLGGGSGYPVRYWRLQLQFVELWTFTDPNDDPHAPTELYIQSVYY